jgi:HSP20 family protein
MAKDEKQEGKGRSGFLGGLTDLLEELGKLAETGAELQRSGEFEVPGGKKEEEGGRKPAKGIYGFSVKVGGLGGPGGAGGAGGAGGQGYKIEPFGNVRRDKATGRSIVEEVREPLVDVFDEEDRLLVVAEMPGVEKKDVKIELTDHTLTFSAERGEHKYRKSLEVPEGIQQDQLAISCKNGIIEISAPKPHQ